MYSENNNKSFIQCICAVEFEQAFTLPLLITCDPTIKQWTYCVHVQSCLSLHRLLYSWDLISFKFKVFVFPMKTAEKYISICASAKPDKFMHIVHGRGGGIINRHIVTPRVRVFLLKSP